MEPTTGGPAAERRRTRPSVNPTVAVAAAVLIVALVVAALLTVGGKGDSKAGAPTDGPAETTPGGSTTTPDPVESGQPRYVTITRQGPGSDLALVTTRAKVDDFSGGPDLGSFPGFGKWDVLSGSWRTQDGQLTVEGSPTRTNLLVAFDPDSVDVRVQVDVPRRTSGSGIAFRVKDARNYLAWTTVPQLGAVSLVRVVDGKQTVLLGASGATVSAGVLTLGIHLTNAGVDLLYKGAVVANYPDLPTTPAGTHIGLVTSEAKAVAAFDNFRLLAG